MKKTDLLSISIIIATFNSERTIDECLKSVKFQDYPKELLELIVVDGGSKDKTIFIAKKYGAKVINVSSDKQNAEYNKGVGVNFAKNEIIFLIDHDNILPHKHWFEKMIAPFLNYPSLVGVEPLRFFYDKKMTALDRYFALIGGSDPVAYYLGKNSHLSWMFDKYNLYGEARDFGEYYIVKFSPRKIPALGGNGAAIRRELLLKHAKADPGHFFHIDVNVDLIKKGYNTYGIFKDAIIHLTNNKYIPFLMRRAYFIQKYYFEDKKKRRYSVYEPEEDKLNLLKYVFYSLTIVVPLFDAVRGFVKIRDFAWFLHPVMSFCMVFVYGIPTVKEKIKNVVLER